jgi:hypothetical protein
MAFRPPQFRIDQKIGEAGPPNAGRPKWTEGNDRNPSMSVAPLLRRRSLAVVAFAALIGAGVATAWLVARDQIEEPRCQPAGQNGGHAGCVASVPIRDIEISPYTTVALTPEGGTLVAAGVTAADRQADLKAVVAGFRTTDGFEEWRAPLEGPPIARSVSISASGTKAALWSSLW